MSKIFIVSDTHFGHHNIIGYCQRPFESAQHMDQQLIQRWNQLVSPADTVYHLGDFAFGRCAHLAQQLQGQIHLIRGNHDQRRCWSEFPFVTVQKQLLLQYHNWQLLLNHWPLWQSRYAQQRPAADVHLHLHGHVHNTLPQWHCDQGQWYCNCSVELWDYAPVPLQQLLQTWQQLTNADVDLHSENS